MSESKAAVMQILNRIVELVWGDEAILNKFKPLLPELKSLVAGDTAISNARRDDGGVSIEKPIEINFGGVLYNASFVYSHPRDDEEDDQMKIRFCLSSFMYEAEPFSSEGSGKFSWQDLLGVLDTQVTWVAQLIDDSNLRIDYDIYTLKVSKNLSDERTWQQIIRNDTA